MTERHAIEAIAAARVVPVITIDDADQAVGLASALLTGGLDVLEITLRTPAGLEAIRRISNEVSDVVVGAGSVMNGDAAIAAIDAGATFLVSPGLGDGVLGVARERGVVLIPGVATPTEVMRAAAAGIETLKLFPAEVVGGVDMLGALTAVWPEVTFMPTGGISADNALDYLARPEVVAVGGSWMVPRSAIQLGDWAALTTAAQECVALAAQAS